MLYEITIPSFVKGLGNLKTLLAKGAEHAELKKFDATALLQSRLIADQFQLTRQIQITCDTAKLCASRLSGKEAPSYEDNETTLEQLYTRIENTRAYLNSFSAKDFDGAEKRQITQPRWEGKWLTGEEYVHHHVLPNFYFHLTTAYSILRHNGVNVGKKDYLGELPYKK